MLNLTQKYALLKKQVAGNREITGYEETFGATKQEQMLVTEPNALTRRILAELEFSIRLSGELQGKFSGEINDALDYLLGEIKLNGAITNSAALKAEEMILPLAPAAKEYKLILAGHAHIDMNWMWGWNETVAATLATFRTVLNLMKDYPEFCFSQSQASVYKIVEDFEPEMMDEIKERIAQGRWEVTASAWVETDKNMPNTESLMRHIKCTKNYLRDSWGISPDSLEIDFSPDTFGHSANLPEIDLLGGVKYYYHCRGLDGSDALYRWRGQSGKEVLVYREQYWYNSAVTPKPGIGIIDISKRCAGLKTGLVVYGVGDHGGGPTRRDIERGLEMMQWPVFPEIKFGTFREFFREAEQVRNQLNVVDHELNFIFPGCYTTQSRIKFGNRRCESALADAQALSAFSALKAGGRFKEAGFEKAWRDVLFTHFHDILTGSCVQESREHALGLFQKSLAVAQTEYSAAMRDISLSVDTSSLLADGDISASQAEGAGAGYNAWDFGVVPSAERSSGLSRIFNIYNPTPAQKTEPVEITVWDYTGDMRYLEVRDGAGNELEYQLLDSEPKKYWDHRYFRILVYVQIDPLAYTTIVVSQGEITGNYPLYYQPEHRTHSPNSNFVLSNEHIIAEFDFKTGEMVSLKDAETGKEYIVGGKKAGFTVVETEGASSNAWCIGRHLREIPVNETVEIRSSVSGKLRNGFYVKTTVMGSELQAEVTLDKNARSVHIKTTVDWHETGSEIVPVLVYSLPLIKESGKFAYNIPASSIEREPMELDVPALSYAAAVSGKDKNAAIITDCKYGFRGKADGTLISTLINSADSPDKYPERGIHKIGLNVGIFPSCPTAMEYMAISAVRRLTYQPATVHEGSLPLSGKLYTVEASNAVVTGVSIENGALILCLNAPGEKAGTASFTFENEVKAANAVDLMGGKVDADIEFSGKTVKAKIPPRGLLNIKIAF